MDKRVFELRKICRELAKARGVGLTRVDPKTLNPDVFSSAIYSEESRYVGKDKFALFGQGNAISIAYFGYMKPEGYNQYKTYRSVEQMVVDDSRLTINVGREGNCGIRVIDKRVIALEEDILQAIPIGRVRSLPFRTDFSSQILETGFDRDFPEAYEALRIFLKTLVKK